MASKPLTVAILFKAGEQSRVINQAIYKRIPLKPSSLRFLHVELKGNSHMLFDAMNHPFGDPTLPEMKFIREEGKPPCVEIRGEQLEISKFTKLNLTGYELYHLDQLPDGTWRLAYSDDMLPFEHKALEGVNMSWVESEKKAKKK